MIEMLASSATTKNLAIWDIDFYNKRTYVPNLKAMKLSMYYKQLGWTTFLIKNSLDLTLKRDKMIIIKEGGSDVPFPPQEYLKDKKNVLIGAGMKMFSRSNVAEVVSACRPDYSLYPENTVTSSTLANASIVQFYHNGKRIEKFQNFERRQKGRKAISVFDDEFWTAKDEDIIACLEVLKDYKNIYFCGRINYEKLMNNEIYDRMCAMSFLPNKMYIYNYENYELLEVLEKLEKIKIKFNMLSFNILTTTHSSRRQFVEDFVSAARKVLAFREKGFKVRANSSREEYNSYLLYWAEILELWSIYSNKPLADFLLENARYVHKVGDEEILLYPIYHATRRLKLLKFLKREAKEFLYNEACFSPSGDFDKDKLDLLEEGEF